MAQEKLSTMSVGQRAVVMAAALITFTLASTLLRNQFGWLAGYLLGAIIGTAVFVLLLLVVGKSRDSARADGRAERDE